MIIMGKSKTGKELGKGISQRNSGIYQARVYREGYGKPIYIYDRDLKQIKKRRDELVKTRKNIFSTDFEEYTFGEWFEIWMKLYLVGTLKATTIRNYRDAFKRVSSVSNEKLNQITSNHIQYVINELYRQGYAKSTIRSTYGMLISCFKRAVSSRIILYNPCDGVVITGKKDFTPKKKEDIEMEKRISDEELTLFFELARGTRYVEFFYILLHTGMRVGEACALEWKDIDTKKKCIHVYKTINTTMIYYDQDGNKLVNPYNTHQITTPKREASNRVIPITDSVIEAFQTWRKKQKNDQNTKGEDWGKNNALLGKYPGLVFTTSTGNCCLPSTVIHECKRLTLRMNHVLKKKSEAEGCPYKEAHIYPHAFRHTFTTRCYEAGMNPGSIMLIIGHANLSMTEYYTHPGDAFIKKEFEKYKESQNERKNTLEKASA